MIQRCFWHQTCTSSVCSRIGQRHRAQQVDVTQVGLAQLRNLCFCVQRPAHQVSPRLSTRRLAGVRYQLDIATVQAGIVDNVKLSFAAVCQHERHAIFDAILPIGHRLR